MINVSEIVSDVMMLLLLRRRRGRALIAAGVHNGRQARRRRVAVDAIHGGRAAATWMTAVLVRRLVPLRRGHGVLWIPQRRRLVRGRRPVRRSLLRLN